MTDSTKTPYSDKCAIIADLWLNYRDDEEFIDFIEYNDLGLPLAYAISNGIVDSTLTAQGFIEEAWNLLLAGLGIEEDEGYETLDDLLGIG
jgi:hypothetical protein